MVGGCRELVVVGLLMLLCCSTQANQCFRGEGSQPFSREFLKTVEQFGLSLFRQVASSSGVSGQGLFMSPYSVWSVLTLAYFGSAGNTRLQLEKALNFSSKTATFDNWSSLTYMLESTPARNDSGASFSSLNRAYFSHLLSLNNCLGKILHDMRRVNFSDPSRAQAAINHDVSVATDGRIPNLISFLAPKTSFVLINAVLFKGFWNSSFSPNATQTQDFRTSPEASPVSVDMMFQDGLFNVGRSTVLNATILELAYHKSNMSMFVLLPFEADGSTNTILAQLTPHTLQQALASMTMSKVTVGIPKFKMTTRIEGDLQNALVTLGISELFEPGVANLTEFSRSGALGVDTIIHEATVEVNEEGTVATAATALVVTRFGSLPFVCDRPFVFLLHDKFAGVTLFAGNVLSADDLQSI